MGSEGEEEDPAPSPTGEPDGRKAATDTTARTEHEENILSQILAPEPMDLSFPEKRLSPEADDPKAKRRKGEADEPTVNISLVAINS